MKSFLFHAPFRIARSPPSRGAWIEIVIGWAYYALPMSPPSRGAWIEICVLCSQPAAV